MLLLLMEIHGSDCLLLIGAALDGWVPLQNLSLAQGPRLEVLMARTTPMMACVCCLRHMKT